MDFKELNVDLDKYTRAFDVIDILYQSLRTSLNVYSTYNSVSDRVGDYKDLLNDYYTKVVERNRMELHDTLIIGISLRCVERIAEDGKQLYRSMSDLVLYATGAAACSTSDLLLVLESINQGLDNIERHLNKVYPTPHGVLERKHLSGQGQVADSERGFPAVEGFRAESV